MKRGIQIVCVVVMSFGSIALTDDFGTGDNQFTIDFVTISGDAGSANGTNISLGSPGDSYYRAFTDPDNGYRIGVHEISNDQWNKFQAELAPVAVTGDPSNAYEDSPHFTDENMPTNAVSWYEAAQMVNWLNTSTGRHAAYKFTGTQGQSDYALDTWPAAEADGGTNLYRHENAFYFLPTEDEWVKAAYWNGATIQTYSNASADDLVSGVPDASKWHYFSLWWPEPWDVASGVRELNGTLNMMGNVGEWTESPYSDADYAAGAYRAERGGAYGYAADGLASSARGKSIPHAEYINGGFRVASKIPEPATLSLLALLALSLPKRGGLAILRCRGRSSRPVRADIW